MLRRFLIFVWLFMGGAHPVSPYAVYHADGHLLAYSQTLREARDQLSYAPGGHVIDANGVDWAPALAVTLP